MASEVIVPRLGELRSRDLQAVHGAALRTMPHVDVLVLCAGGSVAGRVDLGLLRSGNRRHVALLCPACRHLVRLLVVTEEKDLRCRRCARQRTAHQRGRTLADWRRRGGREADRFVRLLSSGTLRLTPARLDAARSLALSIRNQDRARVAILWSEVAALRVEAES